MNNKTITVFGSSLPKAGEREYEDAYKIGKLLAKNGYNVCTGGFQGTMDAVSKGAKENGTEAIGITVPLFNAKPSKYLTKEIQCNTLFQRLETLIEYADGFIILPGGTGTLLELSLVWESINKNLIEEKPIACLGEMWNSIIAPMEVRIKFEKRKEKLIKCLKDVDEIIDFISKNVK